MVDQVKVERANQAAKPVDVPCRRQMPLASSPLEPRTSSQQRLKVVLMSGHSLRRIEVPTSNLRLTSDVSQEAPFSSGCCLKPT
jgi:hypothetical protein